MHQGDTSDRVAADATQRTLAEQQLEWRAELEATKRALVNELKTLIEKGM